MLASGWNGGWERWVREASEERWVAKAGVTGHFDEVRGVAWDATCDYLLSVGSASHWNGLQALLMYSQIRSDIAHTCTMHSACLIIT